MKQIQRYFFIAWTVAMLSVGAGVRAETLGRLFIEPAERARLDQWRKLGGVAPAAVDQAPASIPPLPPDQITLDGYVTRSSGKSTTWINQIPHNEREHDLIVQQRPNRPPVVQVQTQAGKQVGLKAGESLDVHSGEVREIYQEKPNTMPIPATPLTKP